MIMHTLRTIGIVSSAAAVFLSGTIAFAQGRPANAGTGVGAFVESTQERVQTIREQNQIQAEKHREQLAQRLAGIKDKVKQKHALRLSTQFDNLNSTWTDHFVKMLTRYEAILQKVQDRANIAASNGKDIAATNAAIQSAKAAIESARTAIIAQAAKTYTPDASAVTTNTSTTTNSQAQLIQDLKSSFKSLHNTLFKDLFALRDGPMTDARKAVQNALQTLAQIPGVNEGNASSTPASNQ